MVSHSLPEVFEVADRSLFCASVTVRQMTRNEADMTAVVALATGRPASEIVERE
jgi:ABC-type sugar transport system ATPase subunit